MNKYLILPALFFLVLSLSAQEEKKLPMPSDSAYQANIKKSKLYGVYIPRDLDDALAQLMKLTDEEGRNKLKKTDENTVAKKLRFGLGRWMEYNWNFAEGSRFSHYLREKGLYNQDDMVRFMLITFHRHVNGKNLETDSLLKELIKQREEIVKREREKKVIGTVPNND
ncbi:MAG: hypothetical protein IPM26_02430 [Saprospiraceae bacterium]|nr:hypothetical protein [Saprospiraceae bacterium]